MSLTFYSPADRASYMADLLEHANEQIASVKPARPMLQKNLQKYLAYSELRDAVKKVMEMEKGVEV